MKELLSKLITKKNKINLHWKKYSNTKEFKELINSIDFIKWDNNGTTLSKIIYCYIHNLKEHPTCNNPECSKKTSFINLDKGFKKYCSGQCYVKHLSKHSQLPMNSKESIKKRKETLRKNLLENENIINVTQRQEVREKISRKNKEVWNSNSELIQKRNSTMIKKYGAKNAMFVDSIKSKVFKNFDWEERNRKLKQFWNYNKENNTEFWNKHLEHLNNIINKNKIRQKIDFYNNVILNEENLKEIKPLFSLDEYIEKYTYIDKLDYECQKCGNVVKGNWNGGRPICDVCRPKTYSSSKGEIEIVEYIKNVLNNNVKIIENSKNIIPPYELDIYLPDYNLAIEFNGLYWHSDKNNKDKFYHYNKTNLCLDKNIKLLQIFEDEWYFKKDIVKSIINSNLNIYEKIIYGRSCEFEIIGDKQLYKSFVDENHIQGYIHSRYMFGLFYQNELVGIAGLDKSRYNKKFDYELIRLCFKKNYKIIGGFSKLIKNVIKYFNGKLTLISYVDRRYFDGSSYEKSNIFKFQGMTNPNYFYFNLNNGKRYSRIQFQKHKLKDKLKYFNENLSEHENMILNNYTRVYDSGNLVYINK